MEYSNGTAESYRYHTPYENCYPPAVPPDAFQVGQASVSRRFHPYGGSSDPHADSGSAAAAAAFGSYASAAQPCDQCGAVFESVHQLSEHMQSHHYGGIFPDTPYSAQTVKAEGTNETAEILDLDSHKVHVYQPPGGAPVSTPSHPPVVSTPPYTPVGQTPPLALSNPSPMSWIPPNPQPVHSIPAPLPQHDPYRPSVGSSPYPGYDLLPPAHNAPVHMKPVAQPQTPWKPSNPPGSGGGGGGGGPGGGSEVRRPKTYNCEACNKWFTSSGHLKRHYNTTLHKNAIKASSGTSGATDQGRRSSTPSGKSVSSPPDSEEPSLERKPEETHVQQQQHPVSTSSPDTTDTYRLPPQVLPQQLPNPYPQQPQQQQQQHYPVQGHGVQQVDLYRLPYQAPAPYYSQPGLPPPRPLAPPMGGVNSFGGQYLAPQHGGYPPNSMMYPPNLVAPPPSSTVTVPGVGLAASLFIHNNNNNNNVDERKDDYDSVKLEGSDASSPSVGSMDNSDDLENDGSDSEVRERKKTNVPVSPSSATGNFKCTQCHKEFNRVCYLTQHNNTFHKGDKPFKCHMCGKRFQNAELFSQHQQKHAGDKPYKCALCPKQFNHKTDLRRHMCLHTGQKPFMCQVCNKGFIRKDHMVKHVLTHTRRNSTHNNATMPSS